MSWGWDWRPYVPVAQRRLEAVKRAEKMKKKGQALSPVRISGRTIATTFWGKAWCENLEAYSDYSNRLPRGRTYVRNGSVIDLRIGTAEVSALVSGSDIYKVKIGIHPVKKKAWETIKTECAGKIGSLLELLHGRLNRSVMEIVTRPQKGLFPVPAEISFQCSCPDWASMCKHVAAVLYGVGARLDEEPELLFRLREVRHEDLISGPEVARMSVSKDAREKIIAEGELEDIFGIEIDGKSGVVTPAERAKTGPKKGPKKPPRKEKAAEMKPLPQKARAGKGAVGEKKKQASGKRSGKTTAKKAPAPKKPTGKKTAATKVSAPRKPAAEKASTPGRKSAGTPATTTGRGRQPAKQNREQPRQADGRK